MMKSLANLILSLAMLPACGVFSQAAPVTGAIAFLQPERADGVILPSSWVFPDGSDSDVYAYENFTLGSETRITDVWWSGGYVYGARYGKVNDFSITFYETNITGFEPYVDLPDTQEPRALAQYAIGGNGGETADGARYTYHTTLPQPFVALAGVKYWIRIEGYQPTIPDWAISAGRGGNGVHFHYSTGSAMFRNYPGDVAFTLTSTLDAGVALDVVAAPAEGGTVTGGGTFMPGTTAWIAAAPAVGYQFTGWTIDGVPAATTMEHSFTVTAATSAVAQFRLEGTTDDAWQIY